MDKVEDKVERVSDIDFPKEVYEKAINEDRGEISEEFESKETKKESGDETKKENKEETGKGNNAKVENTKSKITNEGEKSEESEKKSSKESEKSETKEELDGTETKAKDEKQTSKETDADENFDEEAYQDTVDKYLEQYDSVEKKQEFVKNIINQEKFTAGNTQRAQELSEGKNKLDSEIETLESERESFLELSSQLSGKEVNELLEKIDDDMLESSDEYYDGEENNVIRKLKNLLTKKIPENKEYVKQQVKILEQEDNIEFEKEVLNLVKLDDKYNEQSELETLGKEADEIKGLFYERPHYSLRIAHELKKGKDTIEHKDNRIERLNKRIKSLELELTGLKSKEEVITADKKPGKGMSETVSNFDPKGKSWDETLKEASASMGQN